MWFVPFSIRDLIDIVLVALIMYWLYRSTRGTNAPFVLTGVIAVYVLWVVVKALNMELLSSILGQVISVGVVALIIIFQPEIRRLINMVGMRRSYSKFMSRIYKGSFKESKSDILPIIEATSALSRSRTGATIVISQMSDLRLITEGGVVIDAKLSAQLIRCIFAETSSLNSGAIIVEMGRIVAAKCILPMAQNELSMSTGVRHRAAIGLSEVSDAIVVVVSQQTGQISIARSGQLTRNLSADDLARELLSYVEAESVQDGEEEVAQ
ncbi:MAG: diadenylate cyclase CdaA [Rikenellaceae bacterium]